MVENDSGRVYSPFFLTMLRSAGGYMNLHRFQRGGLWRPPVVTKNRQMLTPGILHSFLCYVCSVCAMACLATKVSFIVMRCNAEISMGLNPQEPPYTPRFSKGEPTRTSPTSSDIQKDNGLPVWTLLYGSWSEEVEKIFFFAKCGSVLNQFYLQQETGPV